MGRLLRRAGLRHLLVHPGKFGLAALGVALGVALAVAIDVASASVQRSFELSATAISGRATHEVVAGAGGVPEALYADLLRTPALRDAVVAAPFVTGAVALPAHPGRVAQVYGIDPLAEGLAPSGRPLRGRIGDDGLGPLLTRPHTALVAAETARRLGLAPGNTLEIRAGAAERRLTIVAVFEEATPTERQAFEGALFVDLATAQELFDAGGTLTRIELQARQGRHENEALAAVAAALPAGVELRPIAARAGAMRQMTRAFELNLRALSLLALVVGAFLIYNTETFAVAQRRPLLATLRTLGTTRAEICRLVLAEAAIVGALGTAVGLLLGLGLSRGLVHLVSRAVTDLYFVVSVREAPLPAGPLLRGALLGLGAALLSALPAALEATRTEPRLALSRAAAEQRARLGARRAALGGLVLIAAAAALLAVSGRSLPPALFALLFIVVGVALLGPAATVAAFAALGPVAGFVGGLPGRMAARNVVASLSRTGVAVAALLVALSVTVGVSLMVGSFRRAVDDWLGSTLHADVYVTAPALVSARSEGTLPPDLVARMRAVPGVAGVAANRITSVTLADGPALLMAVEEERGRRPTLRLLDGDPERALRAFEDEQAALVSEPFAYKRGISVGGAVLLPTAEGPRRFPVAGVFRDYGSEAGTIMLSRRTYDRHFRDPGVTAAALYAADGVDPEAIVTRVRAAARPGEALQVRSHRALRTASLEVFDRTFEVTEVLRLIALVVAAFGVGGALMALELERTRELGVLRALGFTGRQVAGLIGAETGLLGLVAGLLAAPLGAALAAVLVFVINRRSFGWTMALHLDPSALLLAPLLGLAAGLVGGLYPAFLLSRASPAEALRDE